jgi:hypothetical protein
MFFFYLKYDEVMFCLPFNATGPINSTGNAIEVGQNVQEVRQS